MLYYEIIINAVIGFLASTVKNPSSARAQRLRAIIQKLNDATSAFLAAVPEPK